MEKNSHLSPVDEQYIYLENSDLYFEIIQNGLLKVKKEVWIATANLKDMHVKFKNKFVSITKIFSDLVFKGVQIRLLHASSPSKPYLKSLKGTTFERRNNFQRVQCPRVHFKIFIFDKTWFYLGSANITGAGLGSKSDKKRNFEVGLRISDPVILRNVIAYYDHIWRGELCRECGMRLVCPKPIK